MDKKVIAPCGAVQGIETEHGYIFKGIPYARPPVGELRFHAPQKAERWEGVLVADHFANRCAQPGEEPGSFYYREFFQNRDYVPPMSEDCLYLNVWAPRNADGSCPVAVWFHGGGFLGGHSSEIEFDGDGFARRGVILVTVGYRLGIFGCLCHREARDVDGHSGNYGQLDQIAALDWVCDNISAFGGNPECITVFGQSSGGMGVRNLVASPLAKGKIHRAIIQSCNGYRGKIQANPPMEQSERLWDDFLKEKSMTFAKLCCLSTQELVTVGKEFTDYGVKRTGGHLPMTPVVDGYVLPMSPDDAADCGRTLTIPYMTGATRDDMDVSEAGKEGPDKNELLMSLRKWSEIHSARGVDSFVYYFGHRLKGDDSGAFHSSELWYVFGTLGRCWRPMDAEDYALSEQMADAWTSFMRTGNPGWGAYRSEDGEIHVFE